MNWYWPSKKKLRNDQVRVKFEYLIYLFRIQFFKYHGIGKIEFGPIRCWLNGWFKPKYFLLVLGKDKLGTQRKSWRHTYSILNSYTPNGALKCRVQINFLAGALYTSLSKFIHLLCGESVDWVIHTNQLFEIKRFNFTRYRQSSEEIKLEINWGSLWLDAQGRELNAKVGTKWGFLESNGTSPFKYWPPFCIFLLKCLSSKYLYEMKSNR